MNITETKKLPLAGLTIPEIAAVLHKIPGISAPPYQAGQIFSWIAKGAQSFGEMTNIPKALAGRLEEYATVRSISPVQKYVDKDKTIKLVFELPDGPHIESVLLPMAAEKSTKAEQYTACLSTQAGCPMGCVFCKTGSMGFLRDLTAGEITEQFLFLSDELKNSPVKGRISHIVVMGMGEPLLNLVALRKALEVLCDPMGVNISKRKITVSTAGVYGGIIDLANNGPGMELAVSIASARDSLRSSLMPGAAKQPLYRLKEALLLFQQKQKRQITFETVLLGGVNTGPEDAAALIGFAKNLDVVINIIPWNPVKGLCFKGEPLKPCTPKDIKYFSDMLKKSGLNITQRYRRGCGISGACGQLGGDS